MFMVDVAKYESERSFLLLVSASALGIETGGQAYEYINVITVS